MATRMEAIWGNYHLPSCLWKVGSCVSRLPVKTQPKNKTKRKTLCEHGMKTHFTTLQVLQVLLFFRCCVFLLFCFTKKHTKLPKQKYNPRGAPREAVRREGEHSSSGGLRSHSGPGGQFPLLVVRHLFLVANMVTTSKALVTTSKALVTSSFGS